MIPIWVNSENKPLTPSMRDFSYTISSGDEFSNINFLSLNTFTICRRGATSSNLYIRIDSNISELNRNINSSLKVNMSYWYSTNVEKVANNVLIYTMTLDIWATYCTNLINNISDIPIFHLRSHLHTTNSKFAEDELFSSVQKTVIDNKIFGRKIDSGWYSYPRELLSNSVSLMSSTSGVALPQNNPSANDIFYVFRDKTSGGYKCFPLLDFKVSYQDTATPSWKPAFSLSYVCPINIYDENNNLVSFFTGEASGSAILTSTMMTWTYGISNAYNWYDKRAESEYETYSYTTPKTNFNRCYNQSPSSYKKSNVYFFIQNGDTRDIDIESSSNFNRNFVLYQNAVKFKHPIRSYDDIVLNVRKRGEFEILEYSLNGHIVYRRQITNTNSLVWPTYVKYAWILLSWTRIRDITTKELKNNTPTQLNNLINNANYINDFVGIYKWVPYNMLNDDNYTTETISLNGQSVELIYFLLDKNGTYINGQQFLDGGYMDMFIDKARDPKLNVSNYVMSWNSRVAMETKWWDNVIDPRVHFGTYGNNNEKTSIGIFGYFTFNESGFKWSKTSEYAFTENISLPLSGQLVSATSEYKQFISSQLSTLETGYNLQKEQTNLTKSQNNFNSVFNGISSMITSIGAPLQAVGKLLTGDVGGAIGSTTNGLNASLDIYRNIGNTIYNNKQANLDLKKVKDTTIATVSDKFRSSTNLMTQSSIKDIVLSSTTLYPSGIWFKQQVLAKSTIMGYNNINVKYGFVVNEYQRLSESISRTQTLSWIELEKEDFINKIFKTLNESIPIEFHDLIIDIMTGGFRIWNVNNYSELGKWIYDN